jgi:hypothetical protein
MERALTLSLLLGCGVKLLPTDCPRMQSIMIGPRVEKYTTRARGRDLAMTSTWPLILCRA